MTPKQETPLRGEAKWLAAKKLVAEHNEAAHARGREQRAEAYDLVKERRIAAARKEAADLPVQPVPLV
jgi:hypothetical protein